MLSRAPAGPNDGHLQQSQRQQPARYEARSIGIHNTVIYLDDGRKTMGPEGAGDNLERKAAGRVPFLGGVGR
jgi:hypothetical protein